MTEFCPNAKATILAIAGKIDHLHIICTKQFFYKDTGAQSVLAVNVSSIREKGTYDGTVFYVLEITRSLHTIVISAIKTLL